MAHPFGRRLDPSPAGRPGRLLPPAPPLPRITRAIPRGETGTGLSMPTDPHGPLAGVRVLDASRVLAGPFCGQLLGDLGAEVIKVERPGRGDDTRGWGPPFHGDLSAYYLSCNRNKKAIALDLAQPAGLEVFYALA